MEPFEGILNAIISGYTQTNPGQGIPSISDLVDMTHEVMVRMAPPGSEAKDEVASAIYVEPKSTELFEAIGAAELKETKSDLVEQKPQLGTQTGPVLEQSQADIVSQLKSLIGLKEIKAISPEPSSPRTDRGFVWTFDEVPQAIKASEFLRRLKYEAIDRNGAVVSNAPSIFDVWRRWLLGGEQMASELDFVQGLKAILADRWIFYEDAQAQRVANVLQTLGFVSVRVVNNFIFYIPNIYDVWTQWLRSLQNINPGLGKLTQERVDEQSWRLSPNFPVLAKILEEAKLNVISMDEKSVIIMSPVPPLEVLLSYSQAQRIAIGPRPLTTKQINELLADVWARVPGEMGTQLISSLGKPTSFVGKANFVRLRMDIDRHLRTQLVDASLCVTHKAREDLVETITKTMVGAMARPGKPVSYEAVEAIIAQLTQLNLKSFHSAGSINTISTGTNAAREMINLTKVRSQELITTHFNDRSLSAEDVLKKRQSMVEITLDDIVSDSELFLLKSSEGEPNCAPGAPGSTDCGTRFVIPWWHKVYHSMDRARYERFASSSKWITRLTLSVVDMYRYRITMKDVLKALEKNDCFYCIASPLAEGYIDIMVNEVEALKDMQLGSKYLQEGKAVNTSKCKVAGSSRATVCQPGAKEGKRVSRSKMTESRKAALRDIDRFWNTTDDTGAVQVFHDIEINEMLGEFRVKGIPNISTLQPIKTSYWSVVSRVQMLSPSQGKFTLYEMNFDNVIQRLQPLKDRDVLQLLERQGIFDVFTASSMFPGKAATTVVGVLSKELWSEIWIPTKTPRSEGTDQKDEWKIQAGASHVSLRKVIAMLGIKLTREIEVQANGAHTFYLDTDPVAATQAWADRTFTGKSVDLKSGYAVDVVRRRYELLDEKLRTYCYAMIILRIKKKTDYENITNLCEPIYGLYRRRDINANYTYSNNIHRNFHTLGIYAARNFYVQELNELVVASGGTADPAHVLFMGDFLVSTGTPLPFSYAGARKHNPNALSMMSHQRPVTQALLSAARNLNVSTNTVSGSIYVARPAALGTGLPGVGENYSVEYKNYKDKMRAEGIIERDRQIQAGVGQEDPLGMSQSDDPNLADDPAAYDFINELPDLSQAPQIQPRIIVSSKP